MMKNHQANVGPASRRLISAAVASCLSMVGVVADAANLKVAMQDKGAAKVVSTQSSPCGRVEMGPMIHVAVGKSTLIKPETPVTRILLGNPDHAKAARPIGVANETALDDSKKGGASMQDSGRAGVADVDVVLLSPKEIYLLGKSVGSTNVVLLDKSGQCTLIDVAVGMDTTALQAALRQLMPNETGIIVTAAADTLVLSGMVSDSVKADRAMDLASAFVRRSEQAGQKGHGDRIVNMLSVAAPQQVMLEVKVAEISKSVLDRFGINFARAYAPADGSMLRFLSGVFGGAGAVAGQVTNTFLPQVAGGITGATSNGAATGTVGSTTLSNFNPITGVATYTAPGPTLGSGTTSVGIDAEKKDGLVKILAEPTVMAISGQEGSFLAGGKIFIPVSQNSGSGGQTITLEEKEFGVSVRFTPTVLEGGRINLVVRPEVSELSREGVGISAPGVSGLAVLPSFTTRKASTTVQLFDGQSFAIGGLIKNNVTTNIKAFPILGEIPVLGALFRSSDFQTDRSELVFVITPRLVKPLPQDYQLPTDSYIEPTRGDVFLKGKLEGSKPKESTSASKPATGFEIK